MNVLTAEPESTKTKTPAPPVEEQKPAIDAKPFDVEEIKKKIPKAFQGYVDPIMNWAESVEQRLLAIQQEMPVQIQKSMEAAIESQRQKQMAMYQQAVAQGGGAAAGGGFSMGDIIKLVAGGGGGGYDEEMQKLTKEIMRANLDRIKQDASFTDAIKTAIVTKIAGKAASTLTEGVL